MKTYLYNAGTQVVPWEKNSYVYKAESSYYWGSEATVSFYATVMGVYAYNTANMRGAKAVTSNAVDFTVYSKLVAVVTQVGETSNQKGLSVIPSKNSYASGDQLATIGYKASGTYTLDVSSITGEQYVALYCLLNMSGANSYQLVSQVYLQTAYEVDLYTNLDGAGTYEATWTDKTTVQLTASANSGYAFKGWYLNSSKLSDSTTYNYTPTADVEIEARYGYEFEINTYVDGDGAIDYTRGTDKNDVTFTVIPNANRHFVKYVVDYYGTVEEDIETQGGVVISTQSGDDISALTSQVVTSVEYDTTPLTLHLTTDIDITAYFEEDERFTVNASTNFEYGSVYVSSDVIYSGDIVTLWARPFPDYNFVRWSDGSTENPRQITVTANVTLVAIYQRSADSNGIYQYRAFVKDQLDLEAMPKAFLRVDTFDVRKDLMTNTNSTINVLEMPDNINNGDVLVLYDPKGMTLYQGVIKSISEKKITCSQMQSFYKGTWIYNVSPQDYLEHEVAVLLQNYADGEIYKSSYTDPLVALRLGGITIDYVGTTTANLPTDLDKDGKEQLTQKDMEKFIYELYENYNIIFDFEINISGTNYVHIKVPSYDPIKVGNNMFAIQNMSPITTIEETNRLIIFSREKAYRTTYVATKNGIVEAPTSTANRFDITNTKVVFSDDAVADLVSSNLPETMYNHKVTFTLLVKNFIYQFGDFNLGGELDVWIGSDYYNTVLTGYQIKKQSNRNITDVDFTCGKVRTALTKMLTLKGDL